MEPQKKYCHNCGKPTQVSAKFCSSCGTSLASIDARPPEPEPAPRKTNPTTFTPIVVGEDEDDDEGRPLRADRVGSLRELGISLSSLDVDVRVDPVNKESVGSLYQQGSMSPAPAIPFSPRPQMPVVDPQTALALLQQEAGTLRR